jgi:hypothetical protein
MEEEEPKRIIKPGPKLGLVGWALRYHHELGSIWGKDNNRRGFLQIWSITPADARLRLLMRVARDVSSPDLSNNSDEVSNLFHVSQTTFEAVCPELSSGSLEELARGDVTLLDRATSYAINTSEAAHFALLCERKQHLANLPMFVGMGINKRRIDFFVDEAMQAQGPQKEGPDNIPWPITIFLAVRRILLPRFFTELFLHIRFDESF